MATPYEIKHVCLLGVAEDTYDSLAGGSALALDMRFTKEIS